MANNFIKIEVYCFESFVGSFYADIDEYDKYAIKEAIDIKYGSGNWTNKLQHRKLTINKGIMERKRLTYEDLRKAFDLMNMNYIMPKHIQQFYDSIKPLTLDKKMSKIIEFDNSTIDNIVGKVKNAVHEIHFSTGARSSELLVYVPNWFKRLAEIRARETFSYMSSAELNFLADVEVVNSPENSIFIIYKESGFDNPIYKLELDKFQEIPVLRPINVILENASFGAFYDARDFLTKRIIEQLSKDLPKIPKQELEILFYNSSEKPEITKVFYNNLEIGSFEFIVFSLSIHFKPLNQYTNGKS